MYAKSGLLLYSRNENTLKISQYQPTNETLLMLYPIILSERTEYDGETDGVALRLRKIGLTPDFTGYSV